MINFERVSGWTLDKVNVMASMSNTNYYKIGLCVLKTAP